MSPYDSSTTRTCTTATASTHEFDPSAWLVPDDNHDLMSVHDSHDVTPLPAWYRSGGHDRPRVSFEFGASPSSTFAQQRVPKHQRTTADSAASASWSTHVLSSVDERDEDAVHDDGHDDGQGFVTLFSPGRVDVDDVDPMHAQLPTMMHFWTVSSMAGATGNALLGADTCRCKTGVDLHAAEVSGSDAATNECARICPKHTFRTISQNMSETHFSDSFCARRFTSQDHDRQRDREDSRQTACCLLDEVVHSTIGKDCSDPLVHPSCH